MSEPIPAFVTPDDDCAACPLMDRRSFLHDAVIAAGASLAALGLAPGALHAAAVVRGIDRPAGAKVYPIPAADGVQIDAGSSVILARSAGKVVAMSLACTHQRTPLRWLESGNRFKCPKHESEFEIDGTLIGGRAKRHLDRHAVVRDGDTLVVDLETLFRFDQKPDEWTKAIVSL